MIEGKISPFFLEQFHEIELHEMEQLQCKCGLSPCIEYALFIGSLLHYINNL